MSPQFKYRTSSILFVVTLLLLVFGLFSIYNASTASSFRTFGHPFHYLRQQLTWSLVGVLAFLLTIKVNLKLLEKLAPFVFLISLIFLVLVLIPGVSPEILGARRWLPLFGFSLQPSELAKLGLVLYLPIFLKKQHSITGFGLIIGTVLVLTMLQPDLGTTIILSVISISLYYHSGASLKILTPLLVVATLAAMLLITISPYRRARVATFMDPTRDPLGISYHVNQVLMTLGSGGLTGVGIGKGKQKYDYLPEATTDSIFAITAEETGFVGAVILLTALLTLILLLFKVARETSPVYPKLIVAGVASWITAQVFLNVSAMIALVPLTGIPLPLISYGGSSLVTTLIALGVTINVAKQNE